MVGVAQLVEHRVVVARVAGSSPVAHPIVMYQHNEKHLESSGSGCFSLGLVVACGVEDEVCDDLSGAVVDHQDVAVFDDHYYAGEVCQR